jgi:hypothetical protein
MSSARALAAIAVVTSLLSASPAHGQVASSDSLFALASPPSELVFGCFGPCDCAGTLHSTLTGTFVLHRESSGPLFTEYDVRDVLWVATGDGPAVEIRGTGRYRRGHDAVPFVELELDLAFDGGPPLHFTSAHHDAAPFPRIRARLWLHGEACEDSLLVIDATPASGRAGSGD